MDECDCGMDWDKAKEELKLPSNKFVLNEYLYMTSLKHNTLFYRDYIKLYRDELNRRLNERAS